MKKTIVVNLFGGPGSGKSTIASELFSELKHRGINAELVTEYVKKWAWIGQKVGPFDQVYLFGKQARAEAMLYGKVDVIVTDSPVLLSAYYEDHYQPDWQIVKPAALRFLEKTAEAGVIRKNYWLRRDKPYNPAGRYQTEEEAKAIDKEMREWMAANNVPFDTIVVQDRDRAALIADLVAWDLGCTEL